MALKLVSSNARPRRSAGAFLMTPAQHRAQAALLRKAGKAELARAHDLLADAIVSRPLTRSEIASLRQDKKATVRKAQELLGRPRQRRGELQRSRLLGYGQLLGPSASFGSSDHG